MLRRFLCLLPLLLISLLLLRPLLHAQTITGSVNGTVTDPRGAVIPAAKVTAVNIDTNVQTSAQTNNAGVYSIRFLQVGRYTLTVTATGFADQKSDVFTLEAGQEASINPKLALPGEQQKLDISAELVPLLNTENAQLATTLDKNAIDSVPLVGRNFVQLTLFVPGAVSTTPAGFAGNAAIGVGSQQVSVNGNREQSNNYQLDGIEINETLNNGVGYNPSPDALSQLQVVSANAQAEYGNVNGGDVIALTKSGSNQWHGNAFYYLSDYLLDANTWANKHQANRANIIPRASYTQPIFGGTLGGPVLKDRLFFFLDYEGGRYHQGGVAAATVATARMRQGDFSELLSPSVMCLPGQAAAACNARLIQLYDASSPAFTPYAGNMNVPLQNPVARYLYAHPELYPLPNQAPQVGTPATGNFLAPQKNRRQNDQGDIKIDWKATAADNLSVRYSQSDNLQTTTPTLAITFPVAPQTPVKGFAINEIHTFNSSMVNELRIGFTRVHVLGGLTTDTTGVFGMSGNSVVGINAPQTLNGFSGQVFAPPSTTGLTTANGSEFSTLGSPGTATNYADNSFTYGDNFTLLRGKHTFKLGAQFIRYQQNSLYPGNDGLLGQFVYNGYFTSNPNGSGSAIKATGYSVADFNLDRVVYAGTGNASGPLGPTGQRQWRDAYFVQDDWKVTPTFTANLGVRYEYDQAMYEVNNKQANVNMTTGTLLYAGQNGASRALVNPFYGSVMPRIGFSYAARPRFVVRGGYGIQNYMEGTGANRRITINPPFQTPYFAVGSPATKNNPGTFLRAENGFTNPASPSTSLSLNAWDVNIRPAFISEYSLTTEFQFSNTASLTLGYVGESGQHLVNHGSANQLRTPCVVNGVFSNPTGAACATADPAPYKALVGQAGSIVITTSNAMMNYNALQVTLRQRAWHGFQGTLNYAYGRAMTNAVGFYGSTGIANANNYNQDYYNNHAEYGPTSQDVRHNLNGILGYDLPLGRGRQFGADMNRALDEVIGGWKIGLTGVVYSGFPLTINNSTNNAFTNNKVQRANHLRPLHLVARSANQWFGTDPSAISCSAQGADNGTCAYGSPADGTYGTASVGSERSPGYQQYDATASKDFTVFREQRIGFRVDASNVFNITALSNPNITAQSGSFGQITSVRSGPRRLQLAVKYQF